MKLAAGWSYKPELPHLAIDRKLYLYFHREVDCRDL